MHPSNLNGLTVKIVVCKRLPTIDCMNINKHTWHEIRIILQSELAIENR